MSSNYPPDFDYSVDSGAHDDCVSLDNATNCFIGGLQTMREFIARRISPDNEILADMIRTSWDDRWGKDPGTPEDIMGNWDECLE